MIAYPNTPTCPDSLGVCLEPPDQVTSKPIQPQSVMCSAPCTFSGHMYNKMDTSEELIYSSFQLHMQKSLTPHQLLFMSLQLFQDPTGVGDNQNGFSSPKAVKPSKHCHELPCCFFSNLQPLPLNHFCAPCFE